jgi:hypothetical protein
MVRRFLLLLLLATPLWAQSYTARTDTTIQNFPGTIPCPGSSCAGGGAITGANTVITPTDFNNQITRITDVNTAGGSTQGNVNAFGVDSSAEVNPFNKNDDRFVLSSGAEAFIPYIWNGATMQATQMYASSFPSTNGFVFGGPVSVIPFWSFTQPYIVYTVEFTAGGDPAIYSYDFTSTVSPPSRVLLKDLADTNCAVGMAGIHPLNVNFTVSRDDQNFGVDMGTNGNTGMLWALVWNRTSGCRMWKTDTGVITGDWGTTGTIAMTSRFWQHNARISLDGNYLRLDEGHCLSGSCMNTVPEQTDDIWFWHVPDLTITEINASTGVAGGGHQAMGYTHIVNQGQFSGGSANVDQVIRTYAAPTVVTDLLPTNPVTCTQNGAPGGCSEHEAWMNDNPTDTAPAFFTYCSNTGGVPGYAWDNEVDAIRTDGSNNVYRFSHTFGSCASQFFDAEIVIGSVSQSGKYFMWASDWMGLLGNTDHVSASCTIGTNCRADVFITALPLNAGGSTLQGITAKGVTIH